MNTCLRSLLHKLEGEGTREDKIKLLEAFGNKQQQYGYYRARKRIIRTLKEYNTTSPTELLSLKSILFLIK